MKPQKEHYSSTLTPKHQGDRECDRCGHSYFRRNLLEVWKSGIKGWHKETLKVCTTCLNPKEALNVVNIFGVTKMRMAA